MSAPRFLIKEKRKMRRKINGNRSCNHSCNGKAALKYLQAYRSYKGRIKER